MFLNMYQPKITKDMKVSVLMVACMLGDKELVNAVLQHGANILQKDAQNRNALFYAINSDSSNNGEIVHVLLKHGINVNEVEIVEGYTPLAIAVSKNQKFIVKLLLEFNADVNHVVESSGNSALHLAVKNMNVDLVNALLTKGANLHLTNHQDQTATSLALGTSNTEIYKALVEEQYRLEKRAKEASTHAQQEDRGHNNTHNNHNKNSADSFNQEHSNSLSKHHSNSNSNNNVNEKKSLDMKTLNEHIIQRKILNRKKYKQEVLEHYKKAKKNVEPNLIRLSMNNDFLEIPIDFYNKENNSNTLNSYIGKILAIKF